MASRPKTRLTAEQRGELWRRWKVGESVKEIAAALRRWPNFVYNVVQACGGIASARTLSLQQGLVDEGARRDLAWIGGGMLAA